MIYLKSIFTVLLIYSFSSIVNSQSNLLPQLIEAWETQEYVSCLIVMDQQADLSHCKQFKEKIDKTICVHNNLLSFSLTSQKDVIQYLNRKNIPFQNFSIVNAIETTLNFETALEIINLKNVKEISNNPTSRLEEPIKERAIESRNDTLTTWGIQMIQADSVWNLGYKGEGVIIAGQDTGYDWDNPFIVSKYRGIGTVDTIHDYNWHDAIHEINPMNGDSTLDAIHNPCGLDALSPCDDHGHGSHTMGTMLGQSEGECIGVAPNAKWISCRNMERGAGTPSSYLECFEWFLAPTKIDGTEANPAAAPDVINNSWSCPESEGCNESNWALMETAVENLKSAGVVVVVSAGNSGNRGCGSVSTAPAILAPSFAVGATASNDTIAGFSSRGPVMIDSSFRLKPNISAPGVGVRSIILNEQFGNWSGTSMAGPHVAGAVALIISANPDLRGDVEMIEKILEESAEVKTDTMDCQDIFGLDIPNHVYGNGRLNVLRAVELALGVSNTTNIEEESILKIYPNPASDNIQLENLSNEKVSVRILATSGQVMKQLSLNQFGSKNQLIKDFPKGMYYLNWETSNSSGTIKWIKI